MGYITNEDYDRLQNDMDRRLQTVENNTTSSIKEMLSKQDELQKSITAIATGIGPIQTTLTTVQTAVSTKVSLEKHEGLEERVKRLEGAPSRSMNWLNVIIAGSGCLVSTALTLITIVLGLIYFILNYSPR